MERIVALVALAVLGFVVAGCASGQKSASRAITVTGTTTLSSVKTGTPITCRGGLLRVEVPPGHAAVDDSATGKDSSGHSRTTRLRLNRAVDGSVTVSCTRK